MSQFILTKEIIEKELVENGKSKQQLADELGIHYDTIYRFIKKNNLKLYFCKYCNSQLPFNNDRFKYCSNKCRFWDKVNKDGPISSDTKYGGLGQCWIWKGGINKNEYGIFRINEKVVEANRISLIFETEIIPPNKMACHKCNNKLCVNPSHLYWGNHKSNIKDCIDSGNFKGNKNLPPTNDPRMDKTGENAPSGKLTWEQVVEIRKTYVRQSSTHGTVALGKEYGVTNTSISNIINYKTWKIKTENNTIIKKS